jgi:DNA-binding beta-propeller fold protein YncE
VYLPCDPSNGNSNLGFLLTINIVTDRVVGQIPLKDFVSDWFAPEVLAWDPVDGLLYACNYNLGTLLALNITSQTTAFNATIAGGCAWVIYDPASNTLLVAGGAAFLGGSGLSNVDPQTGRVESVLSSGEITAGVVDSSKRWVALGSGETSNSLSGSVTFVNSSTLAPISTVSFSSPYGLGFGVPSQLLVDPAHGDLYVVTEGMSSQLTARLMTCLPT